MVALSWVGAAVRTSGTKGKTSHAFACHAWDDNPNFQVRVKKGHQRLLTSPMARICSVLRRTREKHEDGVVAAEMSNQGALKASPCFAILRK